MVAITDTLIRVLPPLTRSRTVSLYTLLADKVAKTCVSKKDASTSSKQPEEPRTDTE